MIRGEGEREALLRNPSKNHMKGQLMTHMWFSHHRGFRDKPLLRGETVTTPHPDWIQAPMTPLWEKYS